MGGMLAAIIMGTLMPGCDTTIVAIGISTLMDAFGVDTVVVQWVSTGYLLALAIGIPVAGWLERRRGRLPRGVSHRGGKCAHRRGDGAYEAR